MLFKRILKGLLIASVLFTAVLFAETRNSDKDMPSTKTVADSTQIKIENKLSFYQSEQKKNSEAIQQLEKELEERKKLNERLSGAIVASQELLQSLQSPIDSPQSGEKDK